MNTDNCQNTDIKVTVSLKDWIKSNYNFEGTFFVIGSEIAFFKVGFFFLILFCFSWLRLSSF